MSLNDLFKQTADPSVRRLRPSGLRASDQELLRFVARELAHEAAPVVPLKAQAQPEFYAHNSMWLFAPSSPKEEQELVVRTIKKRSAQDQDKYLFIDSFADLRIK